MVGNVLPNTKLSRGKRSLPDLRQTEKTECGLVCLAMISCYWGSRIDVATLRQRFLLSSRGMNLATMIKIAHRMSFSSRAIRVHQSELRNIRLPAILHWDFKHFVVLKSIGRDAVIHDPNYGIRHIDASELAAKFTGVALEIWPTPEFQPQSQRKQISLWKLVGKPVGFGALFLKLIVIGSAVEAITLFIPILTQWGIDNVAPTGDSDTLNVLTLVLIILLSFQVVVTMLRGLTISSATVSFILDWKINVFSHMISLPVSFFQKRRVGDITSRYDSIETIIGIVNDSFVEGILDSATGLVSAVMIAIYNVPLSLVTFGGALAYILARSVRYRTIRRLTIQSLDAGSKENSSLIETIRGVKSIKIFGREKGREQEWSAAALDEANANLSLNRSQVLFKALSSSIGSVEQAVVYFFALKAVIGHSMSIGMLFAFTSFRSQFYSSVSSLTDNVISLQTVRLHADRVSDIMLEQPEEQYEVRHSDRIGRLGGDLVLENISLRYGEFENTVVNSISIKIRDGENVAIVGKSGCGKSSLLSLIVGISRPSSGQILLGGIPISSLGQTLVRQQMSMVMQDDILFAGTIMQNITAFDSDVDISKMHSCAKMASIDQDIVAMPMGYNSIVSDLGGSLSGGQRQRISIARALYKSPRILIMDEATSSLDAETESIINNNIRRLGITRIIVAHRITTIKSADRLILLDKGVLIADTSEGAEYQDIIAKISGE